MKALFTFQNFPFIIIIVLMAIALLSLLSVILFA